MRFIKTWFLETEDGRTVFLDAKGNYTLDDTPVFGCRMPMCFEERIGQRIKFTDKESGKQQRQPSHSVVSN